MYAQLMVALILVTLSQIGGVCTAVLYFRSETHGLRRDFESFKKTLDERRSSDRELTATQLNAIENSIARVERRLTDIAKAVDVNRRASDHSTGEE